MSDKTYVHVLTEIEIACGVTLEQVYDLRPRVLVREDRVFVPAETPPALASSTARMAFGGPAKFAGLNQLGMLVYRPDH